MIRPSLNGRVMGLQRVCQGRRTLAGAGLRLWARKSISLLEPEPSVTLLALLSAAALTAADTTLPPSARIDSGPVARTVGATVPRAADDTTRPRRRRAVEVSDAYATRLAIHRVASYTMPPLFVAEYVLGQKMIKEREDLARGINNPVNSNTRSAHQWVAGGVAALFGINTVTGVWNLYETRHQEEGRALRVTHAFLMLASDAG